jgi:hypothetical protein
MARVKQLKVSRVALFWLKAKDSLLQESRFGRALAGEFGSGHGRDFFLGIRDRCLRLHEVDPSCFVVDYTKKGALEKFDALLKKRGESDLPIMPFMFQTAGGGNFKGSLFFMFKTPEDAFHLILHIARERTYVLEGRAAPEITQIYEHQPGDSERLAYLIIDCEHYLSHFQGRMDRDGVDAAVQSFPAWFYQQLVAHRFILPDEVVTFVVKRKSREIGGGDFKISYHFVVEIAGTPQWHRAVCARIFAPYWGDIKKIRDDKSMAHLSDEQLRLPLFAVDTGTQHGNQPFAMLYSRKNSADPYPILLRREAYRCDVRVGSNDFDPPPHEPNGPDALRLLYHAAYTVPKGYCANYTNGVRVMVRFFIIVLFWDPVESNHALTPCVPGDPNKNAGRHQEGPIELRPSPRRPW